MPLDFSLDHMGPLTRTARDAGLVLNAIAGFDIRDDTSSRQPVEDYAAGTFVLAGKRIGVPENFFRERLTPEVESAYDAALARADAAGARLVPLRVPDPAEINIVSRVILLAEASALMEPYLDRRGDFGADVIALLDQGRLLAATDYINAQRLRRLYQRDWANLWDRVDCIFTPTAPIAAPLISETHVVIDDVTEDVRLASTRLVRAINVLGLPAASLPLPVSGLPIGLQVIGKPFDEAGVVATAQALTLIN
jgi:aspartyl-tRNA(Asn)/glutamyl-tRNA(Gln) amidotransferase subunit A